MYYVYTFVFIITYGTMYPTYNDNITRYLFRFLLHSRFLDRTISR